MKPAVRAVASCVLLALAVTIATVGPSCAQGAEGDAVVGVGELVSQLTWDSVAYDHMVMTLGPRAVGPAAKRLIEIGKPATPALLAALHDPSRAVAAHLVLCRIWFPTKRSSAEVPLYRDKEIVGIKYEVRKLVWTKPNDDPPVLNISSVEPALESWCRHIPRKFEADVCK